MNVTLRKPNGQVQILNLSPDFSLNKESMFNKNTRGSETMQQRLADIEHDFNGPQPSTPKLYDLITHVGRLNQREHLNPQFIDAISAY